ncbi:F0F1 ATP synthase subunit C [Propionibacteriaceae bacterium Y2011]|uniref:F0F1 ATP synthase subunit C n=1 Tax=Microlunatus sp. Y2014 TaxID=3418488 RepID=UPI003B44B1BB
MEGIIINGSLSMIGAGLAAIGAGIGVGLSFFAMLQGIARQPEAAGTLFGRGIIGAALAEALFVLALVFALFV